MSQTTITINMDEDTRRDFSELCENIGLTMSAAISIFAKKAVSEQKIPFELTANIDPFFSSNSNMRHLASVIDGIEDGTRPLTEHPLIEEEGDEN